MNFGEGWNFEHLGPELCSSSLVMVWWNIWNVTIIPLFGQWGYIWKRTAEKSWVLVKVGILNNGYRATGLCCCHWCVNNNKIEPFIQSLWPFARVEVKRWFNGGQWSTLDICYFSHWQRYWTKNFVLKIDGQKYLYVKSALFALNLDNFLCLWHLQQISGVCNGNVFNGTKMIEHPGSLIWKHASIRT